MRGTDVSDFFRILEDLDKSLSDVPDGKTKSSPSAVRGTDVSDFLADIPLSALYALASAFEDGKAKGYPRDNWRKGFPIRSLISHALVHLLRYREGDTTENHLAHALWNIMVLIEQNGAYDDRLSPSFGPGPSPLPSALSTPSPLPPSSTSPLPSALSRLRDILFHSTHSLQVFPENAVIVDYEAECVALWLEDSRTGIGKDEICITGYRKIKDLFKHYITVIVPRSQVVFP